MKSNGKALLPLLALAGGVGLAMHLSAEIVLESTKPNDTIAVPVGSQSEDLRSTLLMPEYGQSMQSVEDRLGPPQAADTVGTPPITTWKYKDMTVYFEGKTVLRTVVHHKPAPAPTEVAGNTAPAPSQPNQ